MEAKVTHVPRTNEQFPKRWIAAVLHQVPSKIEFAVAFSRYTMVLYIPTK